MKSAKYFGWPLVGNGNLAIMVEIGGSFPLYLCLFGGSLCQFFFATQEKKQNSTALKTQNALPSQKGM